MNKISILLADDHQIIIDGLKFMLSHEQHIEIIHTANNTSEVLTYLNNNFDKVNLVITDINMPSISGLELCRLIKRDFTDIKVMFLSMYGSKEIIKEAIFAEADGYMLKNEGKEKLLDAIHKISNDCTYFSEELIPIIFSQLQSEKALQQKLAILTEREKEILILLAKEYSSEDIAKQLFISPKTVGHHRQRLLAKTDCKSAVGLVKYAIKAGLISLY